MDASLPQRRQMPPEIAGIFDRLSNEVVSINTTQNSYKQLFAAKQEEVDLVVTKLGTFAYLLERVMRHNVILSLCRLLDPLEAKTKSGIYPNLVLQQLVEHLPVTDAGDITFKDCIQKAIEEIKKYCEPFLAMRMQILAHNDMQTLMGQTLRPLSPTNLSMLDEAILKVRNLMNRINGRLCDAETVYDQPIMQGEAKDLVFFLREAQKYEELKRDEQ